MVIYAFLHRSHSLVGLFLILCSHFPHGNVPVMTCKVLLLLFHGTALFVSHFPSASLLCPFLSKKPAAHVVVDGIPSSPRHLWQAFRCLKQTFSCTHRCQMFRAHTVVNYSNTQRALCVTACTTFLAKEGTTFLVLCSVHRLPRKARKSVPSTMRARVGMKGTNHTRMCRRDICLHCTATSGAATCTRS